MFLKGGGDFVFFCVVFMFPNLKKNWIGGVGGLCPIRVFLGFLDLF